MPIRPSKKESVARSRSLWHTDVLDVLLPNRRRTAPLESISLFCRSGAYLLDAGLTVKAALATLMGQNFGPAIGGVLGKVHTQVLEGADLATALEEAKVFPPFMVGYVAIGERTAQLAKAFAKLADHYEAQALTRKALLGALAYPAMVMVMMLAVVVLSMVTVLPGYANIFAASHVALPRITQILLGVSEFMGLHVWGILGGLVGIVGVVFGFLCSKKGRVALANLALKIPFFRLGVNFHIVQGLDILLASGMSISEAVPLCIGLVGNISVKKDLANLAATMAGGEAFAKAIFQVPYIHPVVKDLASVGEATGNLPATMEKCHHYFAASYRHSIQRLHRLVQPMTTIVMGVLLALLMLAVVLPTFELASIM